MSVSIQRFRASRYLVDESILADLRSGWAAVVEAGLENEFLRGPVPSWLRLALAWGPSRRPGRAGRSARYIEASGDKTHELRCLTYLACARLRQHDVAAVKELAPQNEELARAFVFPEYVGMARAMLSWVAWKEGRFAEAELLGQEALEKWRTGAAHYPFYWVALWPLMAVRHAGGRYEEAVAAARELLSPDQMRLPLELETTVESAVAAWDSRQPEVARDRLGRALRLAELLDFA